MSQVNKEKHKSTRNKIKSHKKNIHIKKMSSIIREIQDQVNELRIFQNIDNQPFFLYVSEAFNQVKVDGLNPVNKITQDVSEKLTKLNEITQELKKEIDNLSTDNGNQNETLGTLKQKLETLSENLETALSNPTVTPVVPLVDDTLDDPLVDDTLDDPSRAENVLYRASNNSELEPQNILPYEQVANLSYLMQVEDENLSNIVKNINIQLQKISMVIGQDIGVLQTIIKYLNALTSDKTNNFTKALKQMDPNFSLASKDLQSGDRVLDVGSDDGSDDGSDASVPVPDIAFDAPAPKTPKPDTIAINTRSKSKRARAESIVYDLLLFA